MKKIDIYIIRKFLGTFFFSMVLILSIVIVFDLSERLEKFLEKEAPVQAIIFDYYVNFVPYFANMFSAFFSFISLFMVVLTFCSILLPFAFLIFGLIIQRNLVLFRDAL